MTVYTALPTVSTGDLWTAANHNLYIRDNFAMTFVGMTTDQGDMAYSTSDEHTLAMLSIGTAYQVLTVNSGATAPEWTSMGRMVKIEETDITTTDVASIDFSSIPATYSHLMVIGGGMASDAASTADTLRVRINATTDADDHAAQYLVGQAAAVTAAEYVTNNESAPFAFCPAASVPGYYGSFKITIPVYATTDKHSFFSEFSMGMGVATGDLIVGQFGCLYDVAEAIDQLTIFPQTGSYFVPTGKISLYGIL